MKLWTNNNLYLSRKRRSIGKIVKQFNNLYLNLSYFSRSDQETTEKTDRTLILGSFSPNSKNKVDQTGIETPDYFDTLKTTNFKNISTSSKPPIIKSITHNSFNQSMIMNEKGSQNLNKKLNFSFDVAPRSTSVMRRSPWIVQRSASVQREAELQEIPCMDLKKKSTYVPLVHALNVRIRSKSITSKSNSEANRSNSLVNSSMNESFARQKIVQDDKVNVNEEKYKVMIDDLHWHLQFLNKKLIREKLTNFKLNSIKKSFIQDK